MTNQTVARIIREARQYVDGDGNGNGDERLAHKAPKTSSVKRPTKAKLAPGHVVMFQTKDGALPIERAVSVALGVLKQAGVPRWGDLGPDMEHWPSHVRLTKEQIDDLRSSSHLLHLIERKIPGDTSSYNVSLAVCPACLRFEVVTGAPRGKCYMKLGCTGAPRKVPEPTVVIVNQNNSGEM